MKESSRKVLSVPMNLIDRPSTPDRIEIDPEKLKELQESILAVGLKQPIQLRTKAGRFEVVAGDRRFQACTALGMPEIDAFVEDMTDKEVSIIRGIENLGREDLTVIEEAKVYKRLIEDHGMTYEEISQKTGKSPGLVRRRVDLLKLPDILVNALHKKQIGYAVAEEFRRLHDVARIDYYLGFAIEHGATKEVVRTWVDEELAHIRQSQYGQQQGVDSSPLPEARPTYIACDTCHQPLEVMRVQNLRVCPECLAIIKQNL